MQIIEEYKHYDTKFKTLKKKEHIIQEHTIQIFKIFNKIQDSDNLWGSVKVVIMEEYSGDLRGSSDALYLMQVGKYAGVYFICITYSFVMIYFIMKISK